jgi:hypothetical protein
MVLGKRFRQPFSEVFEILEIPWRMGKLLGVLLCAQQVVCLAKGGVS